ncbi:glycosyl transferase family 2 [Flavipsychrobacter stenotrophus]|uniref:Glycosyl transferase family 2 n=1 Tax=Flavipsychrobacter stenotrophus TaxID=2077091 RepID=A0A2S7STJ2_9BACT|nr:glycosyltransferase [Flavipsychrobacter stenotrophus]PQJ10250.1 glycosyl transferase family 2 [Flavipsychrobacter stenotrophus]
MKVTVIIVNYNVKYFLEVCLHSVMRAAEGMAVEVVVVDNNSTDTSCAMVREKFPSVTLIENIDNRGFSKANNQGVDIAMGEYILFLNPDTVMPEDFLVKTVAYMDAHPKAGSLGPRLIDGKGDFAPDGKKSFPSLSVAIFKTTGINKLFKKSPYFNKYYAVHIGERETAPVEVLSGCCMLVRRSAMDIAGGAFDEDYFMYCEDVDLSYRILKAGFENIYYPEVDLIHYKGESTKKMTLSYVRIFNEALVTFVKKHYSAKDARLFILFINIGIILRAVLGSLKTALKVLRMPLFDALILLGTLYGIKQFWVNEVKNIFPIPASSVYATFPVYALLWLVSLYFNGAYDSPYRPLKVIRGMLMGTIIILAYFGLLPAELRYSRAIIVFSGIVGTVGLLGLHEVLYRLGILKYIPYDKLPKRAVIVADETSYQQTADILQKVHYAPELSGRVSPTSERDNALAALPEMKQLLYTTGVNEVIFCVDGLSYLDVFKQMQECGDGYEYKIHLNGSQSFVGSNSSNTSGDLYTIDRSFNLSSFAMQRNKRLVDIVMSLLLLILFPFTFFLVKKPGTMFTNIFSVLSGGKTWVGYAPGTATNRLPALRPGALPPYNILAGYEPSDHVKLQINLAYAQHYTPATDIGLMMKNFRFL